MIAERFLPCLALAVFVTCMIGAATREASPPPPPSDVEMRLAQLDLDGVAADVARRTDEVRRRLDYLRKLDRELRGRSTTGAFDLARNDVEGCFEEWSERFPGDVTLAVDLPVTLEGVTEPLPMCVRSALLRVKSLQLGHGRITLYWIRRTLDVSTRAM